ncbi:thymopoietin isoform X2 [Ambystoma mexicanum]|uniref:thymopoietin isoform X2 n=1 Tax=Ambystoma mexicanum TaxID=8296 RepID=UPI0037E8DA53
MPDFLENPSALTKDKLKSELLAHNVPLPTGEQRKDVYVQLYLQHLTARNRGKSRDFSSDEEREATPARGRTPRKATKKTEKLKPEERDVSDVTGLSNEDLKEELIKYGLNPGPIMGSTRKVYEKRLLKLKEQGLEVLRPSAVSSTAEETKQNGNTDSDQYSDDDDPEIILKLEKREPLKGSLKAQANLRQMRVEQNQTFSEATVTETSWTSGSTKIGPLQTIARETPPVSRRTPRKRVGATETTFDEAALSGTIPIAETLMASSNQTFAHSEYEKFESRQVGNKVTGNYKHSASLPSSSEFSELPSRTPKKTLINEEVLEKISTEERRSNKDILKEMFPYESSTPTGISVSCRRPIKGAAGRPVQLSEYKMEESFSSNYAPKYSTVADAKAPTTKKGRSLPVWIKILLFVLVAVFLFLVYQAMETNEGNPFAKYLH